MFEVCHFHADEAVQGDPVGDDAGTLKFVCARRRGHPTEGPYSWIVVPTPAGITGLSGFAAELGLANELPAALARFRGSWVEYGVLEAEYANARPDDFRTVIERYGHNAIGPSNYTASSFLARTLSDLSRVGSVVWHAGPATGRWSYNETISYWSLLPEPEWASPITWESLDLTVGYVPGATRS